MGGHPIGTSTLNRVCAISQPSVQVFVITVNWIRYYWTGEYDREGKLERSTHRADARKFATRDIALTVAETHPELCDSDAWKLAPFNEKKLK